jgi:hypothetical protein
MASSVRNNLFDRVSVTESPVVNPFTQHLLQLTIIRSLVLGVLWSVFFASLWFDAIELPFRNIGLVLVVMSLIQGVTFVRIRSASSVTGCVLSKRFILF